MKIQKYIDIYKEQLKEYWLPFLSEVKNPESIEIKRGVLIFNEETSCGWAGPFPGDAAFYSIKDYRIEGRYSGKDFLKRSSLYRETLMLKNLPMKNRSMSAKFYYDNYEYPTIEFPIKLYIFGNDDTSYSKFFRSVDEAIYESELMEECEPLDFHKDILENDFIFTN